MTDETAYVDDHLEPTIDFDWELVDPSNRASIESEIRRQCAITLAKFARRLLELGGRNRNQFFIAANCFAFAAHMHPDQDKSGEEIAKALHLTKAAFFKRVNQCRDVLKLPRIVGSSRKEETRKTFKKSATKHHEKKKQNRNNTDRPTGTFTDRLNDAHKGT